MKLTNIYTSKDCTRKVFVYVDANNHYHLDRRIFDTMGESGSMYKSVCYGRSKFKHIESAKRAINKFIQ